MKLKEKIKTMCRNSIVLDITGKATNRIGSTHFGGQPDVPPDFVWPTCKLEAKTGPLAFLAQFDCEELAQYDCEHLLPKHGVLSFFYEADTQPWGYNPKESGFARVFWFEDASVLAPADYPSDMSNTLKLPINGIHTRQEPSLPDWEDFSIAWPNEDANLFMETQQAIRKPAVCSKLLGWPDVIQNCLPVQCELLNEGYYLGKDKISLETIRRAEQISLEKWCLLFQLDSLKIDDFCLMFGDSGRIYFYISKEDLIAHRFERVRLILHSY